MLKLLKINPKKKKAQGIVEFSLSFLIIMVMFFSVAEYALFWQTIHSVQTFADDLNANLALYEGENICNTANEGVLLIATASARRYLNSSLSLGFTSFGTNFTEISSPEMVSGMPLLKIKITCDSPASNSTTTHATYVYRGLFLFKGGHEIKSLSSVHTPKF